MLSWERHRRTVWGGQCEPWLISLRSGMNKHEFSDFSDFDSFQWKCLKYPLCLQRTCRCSSIVHEENIFLHLQLVKVSQKRGYLPAVVKSNRKLKCVLSTPWITLRFCSHYITKKTQRWHCLLSAQRGPSESSRPQKENKRTKETCAHSL